MSARILLLEDDAVFASELARALGAMGCHVTVIDEGNEGLARAPKERPDLVIVAAELRGVNGFRICNKLKKDPDLRRVPIFLVAEDSSPETVALHQRLETRAEQYMRKPIVFGDLVARMRRHVTALKLDANEMDVDVDELLANNGVGHAPAPSMRLPPPVPSRAPRPTSTKVRAAAVVEEALSVASVDLDAVSALRARLSKQDEANATLMKELADARAALGAATADARSKGAEATRLRNELAARPHAGDPVRSPSLPPANAASAREALKLRETITTKDRELLALRDELGAARHEVVEAKARVVSMEQSARAAEQSARAQQSQKAELEAALVEARRDKEQATRRADDARRRFERVAPDVQTAEAALAEERAQRAADTDAHAAVLREIEALRDRERGEWVARATELESALRLREREGATAAEQTHEAREAANEAAARGAALVRELDEARAQIETERRGSADTQVAVARVRAELEARIGEERDARSRAEQTREQDIRDVQRERVTWGERAQTLREELAAAKAELDSMRGQLEAERQRAAESRQLAEEARAREGTARKAADASVAKIAALGHSLAQAHAVRVNEEQRRLREVDAAETRARTLDAALVDRDRAWTEQLDMLRADHAGALRAVDVEVQRIRSARDAMLVERSESDRLLQAERAARERDAAAAATVLDEARRELVIERERSLIEAETRAVELAAAAAAGDRARTEIERRRETEAAAHAATLVAQRDRDVRRELEQRLEDQRSANASSVAEAQRASRGLAEQLQAARVSGAETDARLRAEIDALLASARAAESTVQERERAHADATQALRAEHASALQAARVEMEAPLASAQGEAQLRAEQVAALEVTVELARENVARMEAERWRESSETDARLRALETALAERERTAATDGERARAEIASLRSELESARFTGSTVASELQTAVAARTRDQEEVARARSEVDLRVADLDAAVRAVESREARLRADLDAAREELRASRAKHEAERQRADDAARSAAQERDAHDQRLRDVVAEETVRRARELSEIQQAHRSELAQARERERVAVVAEIGEQRAPLVEEASALNEKLRVADERTAAARREHEEASAHLAAAHARETDAVRARVDELTQALLRARQALDLERRTQIQEELVTSERIYELEAQVDARTREAAELAVRFDEARVASLESEVASLRAEISAASAKIEDQGVAARAANEQLERDRTLLSRAQEALAAVLARAREPT